VNKTWWLLCECTEVVASAILIGLLDCVGLHPKTAVHIAVSHVLQYILVRVRDEFGLLC
jgi:hypothetical protein